MAVVGPSSTIAAGLGTAAGTAAGVDAGTNAGRDAVAASLVLCLPCAGFAADAPVLRLLVAVMLCDTALLGICLPVVLGCALLLGAVRAPGLPADPVLGGSCSLLNSGVQQELEPVSSSWRLRLPAAGTQSLSDQVRACHSIG